MNKQILMGRIGQTVESKKLDNGTLIANFSVATSESKDETTWHNCVAFNQVAQTAIDYLQKGSRCLIEGRLQIRKYQNANGENRLSYETIVNRIEVIDWPDKNEYANKDDKPF